MNNIFFRTSANGLISDKIKSVAAVNDLSGSSRCSLTVAIPVLYAMGIQCCAMPTAILSNHTGFSSYYFDDYTDKMHYFTDNWLKQQLTFDAIYTGFLGSAMQIDIVSKFIDLFKKAETKLIIDPVMGDNGKIYSTYTHEMCMHMKKLIKNADIITPNITEACVLSDTPYSGEEICDSEVEHIADKLQSMGAKAVIITGIKHTSGSGEKTVSNLVTNGKTAKKFGCPMTDINYTGTGDLFASIICGKVVNGTDIFSAAQFATNYIHTVGEFSAKAGLCANDGICFEKFMKEL